MHFTEIDVGTGYLYIIKKSRNRMKNYFKDNVYIYLYLIPTIYKTKNIIIHAKVLLRILVRLFSYIELCKFINNQITAGTCIFNIMYYIYKKMQTEIERKKKQYYRFTYITHIKHNLICYRINDLFWILICKYNMYHCCNLLYLNKI